MRDETLLNSRMTGVWTDRSKTPVAFACALLMGLRISLVAWVFTGGSLSAQDNPETYDGRTGARPIAAPCADDRLSPIGELEHAHNPGRAMGAALNDAHEINRSLNARSYPGGRRLSDSDSRTGPQVAAHDSPSGIAIKAADASSLALRSPAQAPPKNPALTLHDPRPPSRPNTIVISASSAPGSDFFGRLRENFLPHFRVCTCEMLAPVPIKIPGTRTKVCAMACTCDDGAFGVGLYTSQRLVPTCSPAAETICPWQIKTISPSSPIGLALPLQFAVPQVVGCRLLESRPWE